MCSSDLGMEALSHEMNVAAARLAREAVDAEILAGNPFHKVKGDRTVDKRRRRFVTAEQINSVIKLTDDVELKAIIAARKDDLARNMTEKMLAYALCRQLEGHDEIVVDQLMGSIAKDGYRMQTLITEIVTSYPFTNRRIQEQVASTSHGK